MRFTSLLFLSLGFALSVPSGCTSNNPGSDAPESEPDLWNDGRELDPRQLYQFDSCEDMMGFVKTMHANSDLYEDIPDSGGEVDDGGQSYSETNIQVEGVDEPDTVKTDGQRIVALGSLDSLHVVDVRGDSPALLGSLPVDTSFGAEMILVGDRVFIFDRERILQSDDLAEWLGASEVTRITEVDISDPTAMKIVANLYVEGEFLTARRQGDAGRVVLRGEPKVNLYSSSSVKDSVPSDWLPKYVYEDLSGETPTYTDGLLINCEDAMYPGSFSGLSMLTVLSLDFGAKLTLGHAVGVFTSGSTSYASEDNLYVATTPDATTSYIHKFDITDPNKSAYVASGEVPGYLLSQWAMSEHEGDLRVASTAREGGVFASQVTVLHQDGQALAEVGHVDGLGEGEEVYAVRFLGDKGYVVTYRVVDPLYTLDLSDPTQPTVKGELKVDGFSRYLHPVGEDLLLGVGRDGNAEGDVLGAQLSLFDVSDMEHPVRIDSVEFDEQWEDSQVENTHKAFLYWQPNRLAVLPFRAPSTYQTAAFGFAIDAETGLTEVGVIQREMEYLGRQFTRSLVVGDRLYALSEDGLAVAGLSGLEQQAWVSFW